MQTEPINEITNEQKELALKSWGAVQGTVISLIFFEDVN